MAGLVGLMHYYKYSVKAWVADTAHLLPEEEGIYLRLVNRYYDKEAPIPGDLTDTLRKLRLTAYRETVDLILKEFFYFDGENWIHKHCDQILAQYHQRAAKNRLNGGKGGRPAGKKTRSDTKNNPTETQSEPSGLIPETQTEPTLINHESLITNQETTSGKNPGRVAAKKFKFNRAQEQLAGEILAGVKTIVPGMKEPNLEAWANTIRLMVEQDKRKLPEIREMFAFANKHDFWHKNILCPDTLRKQWDKLFAARQADEKGGRRLRVPGDDEMLEKFATQYGLSKPRSGENYHQYRTRLRQEVEDRDL